MEGSPSVLSGPFAGRYTIERALGRGATATVYLARDTEHNRAVAIKVLTPELAQSLGANRFLREIKLSQRLDHPHILPVLDSGEHNGQLYLVLPYMEEGTLRQRLEHERQLPIDDAVAVARNVAEALDYAHQHGVVHRDVKPENILFTKGEARLADFGIARAIERAADDSTTVTGLVRGTPAYMSPEQASGGRDYDGRSDIYSLACVLYEMLAGMPAFIGPTPEAVIAQRFVHAPRGIRVYRPSVPPSLEAAIQRGLQLAPADRYATGADFARALDTASRGHAIPRPLVARIRSLRVVVVPSLALLVAALALITWRPWQAGLGIGATVPDTTKIVILPLDGDSAAPLGQTYDLLQQGFSRWRGLNVVDRFAMREAHGSEAPVASDREAQRTARETGAGRYVRARVTRAGDGLRLWAALYDVPNQARLYEASTLLPLNLGGADSTIARVADELLLRRAESRGTGSRVLPAVQLFDTAMRAVDAFSLRRADTLLLSALEADPSYARAALWLAQVRTWNRDPTTAWRTWAERASGGVLSQREANLARALVAIGQGEFPSACRIYDSLRALNNRDFAAWYGLGQCHGLDPVVLRDSRSPSQWRFRGSSHRAALAYAHAFELAPALHRSFEARAYSSLRELLYSSRSILRSGAALPPDTTRFFAYVSWAGDSLVHVPYPREMVIRGQVRTDPAARATAHANQRQLFMRIAQSWAAALPSSPGTKEALAVSLEMVGDPSAIDTLRAARTLARDPGLRLRLAAEEVFIRTAFGRRDMKHLPRAVSLADSLLSATAGLSREDAAILAPIAAIVGRCHAAATLAAHAVPQSQIAFLQFPRSLVAAAESLTVLSALGCRSPADTGALRSVLNAAVAQRGIRAATNRDAVESSLFVRAVILTYPLDSARVSRLARSNPHSVLRVQSYVLLNDSRRVRSTLMEKQRVRSAVDVSPDAVYPEARSWLAIGDSAAARRWLDPVLLRPDWLEFLLNEPVNVAGLLRAVALRAELAYADNDRRTAREWASLIAVLWSRSDPQLRPIARRMSHLAAR